MKNKTTANKGFCNSGAKLQSSTAVLRLNFCAKNPPHRQAEKRYRQAYKGITQ